MLKDSRVACGSEDVIRNKPCSKQYSVNASYATAISVCLLLFCAGHVPTSNNCFAFDDFIIYKQGEHLRNI